MELLKILGLVLGSLLSVGLGYSITTFLVWRSDTNYNRKMKLTDYTKDPLKFKH